MQPAVKNKENLTSVFNAKRNSEGDSKRGERKVARSQNVSPSQLKANVQRPATGK
jgi:hypothetical protein